MADDAERFDKATELLDRGVSDKRVLAQAKRLLDSINQRLDPRLDNAYGRLYRRTMELGAAASARDAFERAKERADPRTYSSPWLNLGMMYSELGLWAKASQAYADVLAADPTNPDAKRAMATCEAHRQESCAAAGVGYPPERPGDALVVRTVEALTAAKVKIVSVKRRHSDHLGNKHEVDILAELRLFPECKVPFVIECKDWSRPIPRPVVDGFISFLEHSRFKLGMIVSSSGFTEAAATAGIASGVVLRAIEEFEASLDTVLDAKLNVSCRHVIRDLSASGDNYFVLMGLDLSALAGSHKELSECGGKAIGGARLLPFLSKGRIASDPSIGLTQNGLTIKGEEVLRFSDGEFACYERLLGPLHEMPFLMLYIYMSYWANLGF